MDDTFHIKKEDYYRENGGVIIANPNAPTSICEGLDFIKDILNHNPDVIVIVDEAYIDFGGKSAIELIPEYDNLLVVQTFSKSRSMAGMRIGYAMGNPELIKALNDVKHSYNSYTMNHTSLCFGVKRLRMTYILKNDSKVIETREWTEQEFKKLGFSFLDSKANFIFTTHKRISAKDLFEFLREKHIFVRYFEKPRINNYLRITIGTPEEMKTLISQIKEYMEQH